MVSANGGSLSTKWPRERQGLCDLLAQAGWLSLSSGRVALRLVNQDGAHTSPGARDANPPSASNWRGVPLTLRMCGRAWVGVGEPRVSPSQSSHLEHPLQAGWGGPGQHARGLASEVAPWVFQAPPSRGKWSRDEGKGQRGPSLVSPSHGGQNPGPSSLPGRLRSECGKN